MRGYLGIDPGTTGAAALLFENDRFEIHDWQDVNAACDWIAYTRYLHEIVGAAVEVRKAVNPIYRGRSIGINGIWILSQSIGIWCGILAMAGIEVERVDPRTWQASFFRSIKKPKSKRDLKSESIVLAREFIPDSKDCVYLKKHHNRADALLIAYWYRNRAQAEIKRGALK